MTEYVRNVASIIKKQYCTPFAKKMSSLAIFIAFLFLAVGSVQAQTEWPKIVPSNDGSPISYEIYGAGKPTLVFVHGWSCDTRYWRNQLSHFSKKHQIVVLASTLIRIDPPVLT
jgi:hypothetical protein